jgi:hypothetical protein
MADGLIYFVCDALSHRTVEREWIAATTHVLIHEDQWAFCPAGEPSGHVWRSITPMELKELKLRLAGTIR